MNRYAYCEGNPISLVDPFGLSPQTSQDQTKESKFQWLHNTLDVAGLFFDGADAINAVLYAAEGDWKNAALCAVSVVPLVGSAVVGVVKGAKAVAKAKKATKITELAQESMKLTKNAGNALDTLHDTMSVSTKWGNNPLKIADGMAVKSGTDIAKALETGGDIGTQANKAVDSIKSVASSDGWRLSTKADETADVLKTTNTGGVGGCFVAGTKVKTAEGERNIEDIEVGDYVFAENAETGEQEYKQVVKTFIREKTTLVHVYVGDEEIKTTLEHPFYVEGFGFVPAGELQAGDIIQTSDGRNLPIKKVEIEELEGTVLVYNFEVEDFHTYYVSDLGVLVHNMCAVSTSVSNTSLSKYKGTTINYSTTKKGELKVDYLFENRSDAMNYARNMLGHDAIRIYDDTGKWIGWSGSRGKVYWGHGDWGQGLGKSTFPHLNYDIGTQKGHLFLRDKIINRDEWDQFSDYFGL